MNLQVDLRDVSAADFVETAQRFPSGVRVLITAWQWALWKNQTGDRSLGERATVMLPDFLHYARLAGTGQPREILRLPGSLATVASAAMACAPSGVSLLPGLATGQFWPAAEAMTRYDAALLGRNFPGEVILHYNLTDFACFFDRVDFFRTYRKIVRKAVGGWGFATQQNSSLLSLCSRNDIVPDRLVFPTGMNRPETLLMQCAQERQFASTRFTIDYTQWPGQLLAAADLYDFGRPFDDTWLVSCEVANDLC